MNQDERIFRELAKGMTLSGEHLAVKLGVTRAAIWKSIRRVRALGLDVVSVHGKGYRVKRPIELLDASAIMNYFSSDQRGHLAALEVAFRVDSTNDLVMARQRKGDTRGLILLAECQVGGKGRRGRTWTSPLGGNIYASVSWSYEGMPRTLGGLSLALAAQVINQLERLGWWGLEIKWPNDIVRSDAKVGGILIEVVGEPGGRCYVVCGIGLNVSLGLAGSVIDQPWTELGCLPGGVSRNQLAASVCGSILETMVEFPVRGFQSYKYIWSKRDVLRDRKVVVYCDGGACYGVAKGVDDDGALIVDVAGECRKFHGGEVSVRTEDMGH